MACDLSVLTDRTLKVTLDDETRRVRFSASGEDAADMLVNMQNCVATAFDVPVERVWLGYADEEGDVCTLTEQSIHDLSCVFPEGLVRLTLKVKQHGDADTGRNACADAASEQPAAAGAALLRKYLACVPAHMRPIATAWIQGMPAESLHGFLEMALASKEGVTGTHACGASEPAPPTQETQSEAKALCELCALQPHELKALLLKILQNDMEVQPSAESSSSAAAGSDCNPFGDMMGMLGPLLAAKGCGKGTSPYSRSAGAVNPMEQIMSAFGPAFAAKGVGKGAGSSCRLGDLQSLIQGVLAGQVPVATSREPDGTAMAVEPNETAGETRTAFEDSVNDLVSMGLVSDRQMARELLTQHGDISTVVSVLTEAAS